MLVWLVLRIARLLSTAQKIATRQRMQARDLDLELDADFDLPRYGPTGFTPESSPRHGAHAVELGALPSLTPEQRSLNGTWRLDGGGDAPGTCSKGPRYPLR